MLRTLFALVLLAGCCEQVGDCPDQSVVLFVIEDGAGVEGVSVTGDLALECEVGETETASKRESNRARVGSAQSRVMRPTRLTARA